MPYIDAAAAQVLRWTRRMPWLEHVLVLTGWSLGPLALVTLVISGELLAVGSRVQGLPPFATLRGMHLLSAEVLLIVLGYRGLLMTAAMVRWGHRPGLLPRLIALRPADWTALAVRVGVWGTMFLLLLSGLERYAALRYGWHSVPPGNPAFWPVLHRLAAPYFYAFLVLSGFLSLRGVLPSLRDYLVRHY